jgi:death on curing protein
LINRKTIAAAGAASAGRNPSPPKVTQPAYLFHLAKNHPFVDGNKRVALSATLIFMLVNDMEPVPAPDDALRVTLEVAEGRMSKAELTAFIESLTSGH